ncbi:MAG: outer membrane beta-barrel protein [Kiritimatiellae bacterium]|nr:outer membrane beta-barrel protein [Kiritimatiellia bacterium]
MSAGKRAGFVLLVWTVLFASAAFAGEPEWAFEITPYAWLVNIDGSVSFEGREADFSADFKDLFENADFAGSLLGTAARGRWVGFAQADFFSLERDIEREPGGTFESDLLFLNAMAGYRFDGFKRGSTVEVLAGIRYLRLDGRIEVNGEGAGGRAPDALDGMVMLHGSFPLRFISEKLRLNTALSVGAGDSDLVWGLQPDLQYHFNDRFSARAGYRRLQYEFSKEGADLDMGFQGFLAGVSVAL